MRPPPYEAEPPYRSPSGDGPRYDYESVEDTFGYYDENEAASYGEAVGRQQQGRVNGRGRREGPRHGGGLVGRLATTAAGILALAATRRPRRPATALRSIPAMA